MNILLPNKKMLDMATMKTKGGVKNMSVQTHQKQPSARTGVFVKKTRYIKIGKKNILGFSGLEMILS